MNPFQRDHASQRLRQRDQPWDLIVIGGGATGVGVTLDAATRGLDVLLVEQSDFGKGTSSRSTKLIHGGVRYLRAGNLSLVREALRERSRLLENAPDLVHELGFVIPCRSRWERLYYATGLKLYDWLASGDRFGPSRQLSLNQLALLAPAMAPEGLFGGVLYHDGQFDDARLLISMARTAANHGGCLINYLPATGLIKDSQGHVVGVQLVDQESGETFAVRSRSVVNASGPFSDSVRRLDEPGCKSTIAPSQGVHLVLPGHFFPGSVAMIVPQTSDGRVIFIIPWHHVVLVGTTDTPIGEVSLEPTVQDHEIEFLLETSATYLSTKPTLADVLSVFTGIRPLVDDRSGATTAAISRDHVIRREPSGMVSIAGGKWTTVRKMSEDCVDHVVEQTGLTAGPCVTGSLPLLGDQSIESEPGTASNRSAGQQDRERSHAEPSERNGPLHDELEIRASDVVRATRYEMARTIDDVLARRTRSLIFNAPATIEIAGKVAKLMADVLRQDQAWIDDQVQQFGEIARHYLPPSG